MDLGDIVRSKNTKGFTIVELLIVVVVIGILASIVIIAFNGVQNKAKTTKALTNASAVQDTAEGYYADNGAYPLSFATLRATTNSIPIPTTVLTVSNNGNPLAVTPVTSLTAATGQTTVQYDYVGTGAGARIVYWDFVTGKPSTNVIYLGTATSASTFITTL